jgi:hypothetical protein
MPFQISLQAFFLNRAYYEMLGITVDWVWIGNWIY